MYMQTAHLGFVTVVYIECDHYNCTILYLDLQIQKVLQSQSV